MSRRAFLDLAVRSGAGVVLSSAVGCRSSIERAVHDVSHAPRQGGLDATFFVTADTHAGFEWEDGTRIEPLLERQVESLVALPARPWPVAGRGDVARPLAVVVAGDLTEDGKADEWDAFAHIFGLNGRNAVLPCPVYESIGNHDRHAGDLVESRVVLRHGSARYAVDMADLSVIQLGEGPKHGALPWLAEKLAEVGPFRPVILVFHYPLLGPYSGSYWAKAPIDRWRLLATVRGYNVVAMIHGHYHGSGTYQWHGIPVFNVGSAKHRARSHAVVRVTDSELAFASWNWERACWWWSATVPINGTSGAPHVEVYPDASGGAGPAIPYPTMST